MTNITDYKYQETKMDSDFLKVERVCLLITIVLNLILSVIEITFYFLTGSLSILFDGIFSSIMSLTTLLALWLGYFIAKRSFNYPFGKAVYDNIFSMFKALLIIGTGIGFLANAITDIIGLTNGTKISEALPSFEIYVAYIVVSCVVSIIIFSVYHFSNKKINGMSIILNVEKKSSLIDLGISLIVGIALLTSSLVANNDAYVRDMVDKSITIFFVILVLPPIFKFFIEQLLNVTGYRMYKDEEKELRNHLQKEFIDDVYIQRHNSEKIFMITINLSKLDENIQELKKQIDKHIYEHYSLDTKIFYVF